MHDFAQWLRHTAVSEAIWSSLWLIRLMQATHLLVAGVVSVSGLVIALRALGVAFADEPFDAVWQRFAPWLGWSFAIMLVTGIGQTLGDPVREFTATSWWLKMALILWCVFVTLLAGAKTAKGGACKALPGNQACGNHSDRGVASCRHTWTHDCLRSAVLGRLSLRT